MFRVFVGFIVKISHVYWTRLIDMSAKTDVVVGIYRVAQKSKPLPMFQKIVLKIANEIRFIRKVKVWTKHYI